MNIRANASFRFADFSRLEALLVPKLTAAAQNAANAVLEISQDRVPVDTGRLKASGGTSVEWSGQHVRGYVVYTAPYSIFVEMGVGRRGAAGEWAGPFNYGQQAGFAGFGFCRSSLDTGRPRILAAYREALGV